MNHNSGNYRTKILIYDKTKKEHKISLAEEIDNHKKHEQEKKSIKVLEKKVEYHVESPIKH